MQYDVIIIGAGFSGMSAAVRLSRFGKKVALFESHSIPGGLNSWFPRNGQIQDVGLHAMTNCTPKENRSAPLSHLFRQLQWKRETLELCPQSHSEIRFPDLTLRLTNHFEEFRQQIARTFPDDLAGFDTLCHSLPTYEEFSQGDFSLTASTVLKRHISSPLLRNALLLPVLFYGSPTENDISYPSFSVLFPSIFQEGFMRPKQGIKPLLDSLLQIAKVNGTEFHFGNRITRIKTAGDQITGIVDQTGTEHTAEVYLSCAGWQETLFLCDPPKENTITQSQEIPPSSIAFLECLFRLNRPAKSLGIHACVQFCSDSRELQFSPPPSGAPYSHRTYLLAAPGNYIGCEETPDAKLVRFSAIASPNFWLNAPPRIYQMEKENAIRKFQEILETRYPGFSRAVSQAELFTPRTILRYTGHRNGAIYGSTQKTPDGSTRYTNLKIIGTDQGLLGIVGSMISGLVQANRLLLP